MTVIQAITLLKCFTAVALKKMTKIVQDKDSVISSFEQQLKELKVKFEQQEKQNTDMKKKIDDMEIVKKPEDQFPCHVCDFRASSKNGLKVHIKRKHTSYSAECLPVKCDICEEKFVNCIGEAWDKERIEEHRISHSYKCSSKLKYKCEECEFWGPNTRTMEMHVKKLHSEDISCGICDLKVKNVEELETHLVTCEVYRCSDCKTKFSTVSDIKKHINKDHKGRNVCLTHLKTNRDHFDFIDDNFYTSREFFKK